MPNRKGSHDIASTVRGAFLRAAKQSEEDNRPLSTIMLEMLQKDPKGCLDTVAKFVPKEMLIEQSIEITLAEMSDEAVDGEIARLLAETAAANVIEGAAVETKH